MKVAVVIPTKNESETIGSLIKEIRSKCESFGINHVDIIITDDSRDKTRQIARAAGATVVVGGGKGLGSAMYKGLKEALRFQPEIIISLDADGQVDLNEIEAFKKALVENDADLVLGSRFKAKDLIHYKYKFINRFGVRVLVKILNFLTKLNLTDSHGGIRAMRPQVVESLEIIGTHTYVQEAIIDAYENGYKVIEIPSAWLVRQNGKSRVVLSIPKYIFYTLPVLILRSGGHIQLLFPLGLIMIMLAFIDIIYVAIETNFSFSQMIDRQSFNLFILLFLTGINLFFFGFALELIANIKRKINL